MMTIKCPRCNQATPERYPFCQSCGKLVNRDLLRSIKPMGFVGPAHSLSPKIEEFWERGDPAVFSVPGDPDFRG